MSHIVRTAMIGCGGMARWHVQTMLQQAEHHANHCCL